MTDHPDAPDVPGVTRWRKRPVVVEACRWTGANLAEVQEFTGRGYFGAVPPVDRAEDPDMTAEVYDKLHGTWVHVYDGQWIIRGIQGELYPCAADVFAATYEPAGEPDGTAEWPADALHARGEGIRMGESWVLTPGSLSYREAGERILSALDVPRAEWPVTPAAVRLRRSLTTRQGRKVPRMLYRQLGDEPADSDPIVGLVDTPELAALIVAAVNGAGARTGYVPERARIDSAAPGTQASAPASLEGVTAILAALEGSDGEVPPLSREELGRLVREVWLACAREHPDPKPSWLAGWDKLDEWDKETDRRIGKTVANHAAAVTALAMHALHVKMVAEAVSAERERAEAAEGKLERLLEEITAVRALALTNGIPLADLERMHDAAHAGEDGSEEENGEH